MTKIDFSFYRLIQLEDQYLEDVTKRDTSFSISGILHPPTLQPNTGLYKMSHTYSRLSEKPHPATTLSKLFPPFTKIVTTNNRQYGNSLLPVTTL